MGITNPKTSNDVLKYDGVAARASVPQISAISPPPATATANDATSVSSGSIRCVRAMTNRYSTQPIPYITTLIAAPSSSGSIPVRSHSHQVMKAAAISSAPCARLMTFITPKISVKPDDISA